MATTPNQAHRSPTSAKKRRDPTFVQSPEVKAPRRQQVSLGPKNSSLSSSSKDLVETLLTTPTKKKKAIHKQLGTPTPKTDGNGTANQVPALKKSKKKRKKVTPSASPATTAHSDSNTTQPTHEPGNLSTSTAAMQATGSSSSSSLQQKPQQSFTNLLTDFSQITSFGLLPTLTVDIQAQGGLVVSTKGFSYLQMNAEDINKAHRRIVALGKTACALLSPLREGMTVKFTNVKATRARSGGAVEFHVTDSNVAKVTATVLCEVKRKTHFTPLKDLPVCDANAIINVELTVWKQITDGPVLKLLCFDEDHSVLIALTGQPRDNMMTTINTCSNSFNLDDNPHVRPSPTYPPDAVGLVGRDTLFLGSNISFANVTVSHVGLNHLRSTPLTIIDVITKNNGLHQDTPCATKTSTTSFPMTTCAMHIPMTAANSSKLLEVQNSLHDPHAMDYFIVHASLASVSVGKTRSGDISTGFKLEDSSCSLWANCYGDKIAPYLQIDVRQFNSMNHTGKLRSHIETLFAGSPLYFAVLRFHSCPHNLFLLLQLLDCLLARVRVAKSVTPGGRDYITIEEIYPAPTPVSFTTEWAEGKVLDTFFA